MSHAHMISVSALLLLSGFVSVEGGLKEPDLEQGAAFLAATPDDFADRSAAELAPARLDAPLTTDDTLREPMLNEARAPEDLRELTLAPGRESSLTNWRGRRVAPARVPYFDDFEHRMIGAEWRVGGTSRSELSSFAGPFTTAPQFLDLETVDQMGYIVEFDLYIIEPGDAGCTFAIEVDGVVMFEESFAALDELAQPVGARQVPVVRGARMAFIATNEVTELMFGSVGDAGQSWGIDNVRIEVDPSVTLAGLGEESEYTGGGAGGSQPRNKAASKPRRGAKVRGSRGGRGGSSSSGLIPPDFSDLIDDEMPEDEIVDDFNPTTDPAPPSTPDRPTIPLTPENPTQGMTPEDPPGDPDVPAPGSAVLLLMSGAAAFRRRR